MNLKTGDLIAAGTPSVAFLTLSQWNQLLGIIGTLLGIAYLVWKWRKEAKK